MGQVIATMTYIIDLRGFSMALLSRRARKFMQELLNMAADNYPELLARVYAREAWSQSQRAPGLNF